MRATPQALAAGSLLVLGLLYGALAVGEGLGSVGDTGAGFFPFVVALALVVASATILVQGRRGTVPTEREDTEREDTEREGVEREGVEREGVERDDTERDDTERDDDVHWWRIAGVLVAALLVPAVGDTVGTVVTLSVSLVLIAKVMGVSRWSSAVILGVAFGAATWLIFVYWLFVPLPAGTLGLV